MIVGIAGTNASGKTTAVGFLETKGFTHFSARTFLSAECKKRNLEPNRPNLVIVANDLREKHGPDYIIRSLYEMAQKQKGNIVIESIRSVGEITYLKTQPDFTLLAIDADVKKRYDRAQKRGSATDKILFDEFVAHEQVEAANVQPFKQNIVACMQLADILIKNDGTLDEFKRGVFEKLSL